MPMPHKLYHGFTLLEFLVAMAVITIMTTVGIPSFLDMIVKHRLKGATEAVYGDLQLARMEAIKRNKSISLSFQAGDPGSWCYAIHDNNGCDCHIENDCRIDEQTSPVTYGQGFNGIDLETNFKSDTTSFNPVRGTSNSGSITLTTNEKSSKLIVSSLGRIRVCSNDLGSYPSC